MENKWKKNMIIIKFIVQLVSINIQNYNFLITRSAT